MYIIAPHISCVVYQALTENCPNEFQDAIDQGYKEIFVITPCGIYKHHILRDGENGASRYVQTKVTSLPNMTLNPLPETIQFLPAGKVPIELFHRIVQFFKQVMQSHKSELEAMAMILWNPQQGYHIFVPDQTISKASVRYDWEGIPAGSTIVVDIHSHNTMNAFFSGTDNNDDRNNITYSGVVGHINNATPATCWRFNYRDKKIDVKLEDIFEAPEVVADPIPSDWLGKVKTTSYANNYTGYQGKYAGQGYVYGGAQSGGRKQNQTLTTPTVAKGGGAANKVVSLRNIPPGYNSQQDFISRASDDEIEAAFGLPPNSLTGAGTGGSSKKEGGHAVSGARDLTVTGEAAAAAAGNGGAPRVWPFRDSYRGSDSVQAQGIGQVYGDKHIPSELITSPEDLEEAWALHLASITGSHQGLSSFDEDSAMSMGTAVAEEAVIDTHLDTTREGRMIYVPGEDEAPFDVRGGVNGIYEAHVVTYGAEIADAYDDIDNAMPHLEGQDELLLNLSADMIGLMSEEKRTTIFRAVYNMLPDSEKMKIATNGI